jgi:hypothetical protein
MRSIVIANCGGFWGDDPTAARRQVDGGPIDYLVMDYLAEVTMAILNKQMARDSEKGYAGDLLLQLRDVLVDCVERGITIISNAGGVNPLAARDAVQKLAADLGVADRVKVGVVAGDNLYPRLDELIESGEALRNIETGAPIDAVRPDIVSANAYLGAGPIVKALEMGANVVICGRVTDAAVALAPMIHEFGWAEDEWDKIASGVVAGHIIECGLQATGGNFTDWDLVPSWANMGYPLVEANEDGTFVVTKHPDTGGLVSVHTITEQLLYEIGPPGYLSADAVARFDTIVLEQDGPDRVAVSGVRGEPAPDTLKVSISHRDGYRAFGRLLISGPDALDKAELVEEVFWESIGGEDQFEEALAQVIGWDATHPAIDPDYEPNEVILQLGVRDRDAEKITAGFSAQVVPKVLGTVPGITYIADHGRPRPSEVVGFWPALISRSAVTGTVIVDDMQVDVALGDWSGSTVPTIEVVEAGADYPQTGVAVTVPLSELCLARSGDKGNIANIGVIGRSHAVYSWMLDNLTVDDVSEFFDEMEHGEVERFELPNLLSVNFLIHDSLGGGGTRSLMSDPQAKTFAQFLLTAEVTVDEGLLDTI